MLSHTSEPLPMLSAWNVFSLSFLLKNFNIDLRTKSNDMGCVPSLKTSLYLSVCLSYASLSAPALNHLLLFSTPKELLKGKCSVLFPNAFPVSSTKPESCCRCSVAKLWPTLRSPVDCGLPGSSVCGALQARMTECAAIPFSMGSSWPRD